MSEAVSNPAPTDTGAQAQAAAPQAQVQAKQKQGKTGNFILDVAAGVEQLTKTKALNRAEKLVEDIDNNSFELGGVLAVILAQGWFDPFESFGDFVFEKYGFQERKARYLIEIYEALVKKLIPWEKVAGLGWTKLKDLARFLTPQNVDEWVDKASKMTVKELQAVLKASENTGEGGETKTTSEFSTIKFKVKPDQMETVQSALSKGKAEMNTEYDAVVLENICAGYLGGTVAAAKGADLKTLMAQAGWEAVLNTFGEQFPEVNLSVEAPTEAAAQTPAAS